MKYIRIDEDVEKHFKVFYFMYPVFFSEDDPMYDSVGVFANAFDSYEEAMEQANIIIKNPWYAVTEFNNSLPKEFQLGKEYIEGLDRLQAIDVYEELVVADSN